MLFGDYIQDTISKEIIGIKITCRCSNELHSPGPYTVDGIDVDGIRISCGDASDWIPWGKSLKVPYHLADMSPAVSLGDYLEGISNTHIIGKKLKIINTSMDRTVTGVSIRGIETSAGDRKPTIPWSFDSLNHYEMID